MGNNSNILHTAYSFGSDYEVIACIVKHNPDACSIRTKQGYTPLRNAVEYACCSMAVVKLLVKCYPTALNVVTKLKETPTLARMIAIRNMEAKNKDL